MQRELGPYGSWDDDSKTSKMLLDPYPGPRAPQINTLWVVVPFSRPHYFDNVWRNFERQRFPGKRLLIAANGLGSGAESMWRDLGADFIATRDHQSTAKNEALAFIRKHGGGCFSIMDDDDWYGPGYLDEVAGYAKDYEALGKQWHFVSLGEGDPGEVTFVCANRRYANLDPASWFTGGTISGWAETAKDFPVVAEGEDIQWCHAMKRQGARLRGLSIYHYLYRRSYGGAKHAWRITRQAFERALRVGDALEFPLTGMGQIDLDIVTGEKNPTECRLIGQQKFVAVPA